MNEKFKRDSPAAKWPSTPAPVKSSKVIHSLTPAPPIETGSNVTAPMIGTNTKKSKGFNLIPSDKATR
jgi:hypothetical protein